jgi:hypothetical protein
MSISWSSFAPDKARRFLNREDHNIISDLRKATALIFRPPIAFVQTVRRGQRKGARARPLAYGRGVGVRVRGPLCWKVPHPAGQSPSGRTGVLPDALRPATFSRGEKDGSRRRTRAQAPFNDSKARDPARIGTLALPCPLCYGRKPNAFTRVSDAAVAQW